MSDPQDTVAYEPTVVRDTERGGLATELAPAAPAGPPVLAALMSDDEIRRYYRIAEALCASGMWKDVKKAEAAFAKMIIGRDLGMTPAQSMQGIYIVEGGIQMHYATLGQFVRAREGYDYRAGWLKLQRLASVEAEGSVNLTVPVLREDEGGTVFVRMPDTGEVLGVLGVPVWDELVTVWHDEEEAEDTRDTVGAVVVFEVNGERRGLSRYTVEDARTAGLIKDDKRAAWNTSRRNMLLARAMSNGVKWFVPECLGGLPVYVEGELDARKRPELTAGTGDGDDAGQGIDLGPKVEAMMERAEKLGHRGLANRAAIELAVGNRSPRVVNDWLKRAREELDRFEAEKAAVDRAAEGEGEKPDPPAEEPVAEEVSGEVVEAPEEGQDDPEARLRAAVENEGGEVQS